MRSKTEKKSMLKLFPSESLFVYFKNKTRPDGRSFHKHRPVKFFYNKENCSVSTSLGKTSLLTSLQIRPLLQEVSWNGKCAPPVTFTLKPVEENQTLSYCCHRLRVLFQKTWKNFLSLVAKPDKEEVAKLRLLGDDSEVLPLSVEFVFSVVLISDDGNIFAALLHSCNKLLNAFSGEVSRLSADETFPLLGLTVSSQSLLRTATFSTFSFADPSVGTVSVLDPTHQEEETADGTFFFWFDKNKEMGFLFEGDFVGDIKNEAKRLAKIAEEVLY